MRHPALIALLCLWLAGCAAIRPPVPPADPALFVDALFGAPELPAEATDIFAFSPAMQQHLARHIAPRMRNAGAHAPR